MFDFLRNCIIIARGNYFKIIVNVSLNNNYVATNLQCTHTCNHGSCPHLHHPLWDTFATIFLL